MAKNFGLGKGLGALISEYDTNLTSYDKDGNLSKGVREIELSEIDINPDQPRKHFDETALRELAASIKAHGVIQPIIVSRRGERYMIVAGERRYRAARMNKLDKIPVVILDLSPQELNEVMIIENLQREDLNPIEEATGLNTLLDEYKMTQEQLATRLGKSRPAITNALRLLTLPAYIQDMLRNNKLTAGHARCLVSVKDPAKQRKLATLAAENKMTVRQLEQEVNGIIAATKRDRQEKAPKPVVMKEYNDALTRRFATRVKIDGDKKRGKIIIEYFNEDDFNRIYEIIIK
ncbi:MAG: ParB/RepB/Spo0J family partition protein [Christensenellales bacterium]|jgi:ParB family chromosome partitioning protein